MKKTQRALRAAGPVDRPALRLFFATLLHDGPLSITEVRKSFRSEREYLNAVYALSMEGFIEAKRRKGETVALWHLSARPARSPSRSIRGKKGEGR